MRAIELNGEAVEMNKRAFLWGRRAAFAPERVAAILARAKKPAEDRQLSQTLDEIIARRIAELTAYQNAAYAQLYRGSASPKFTRRKKRKCRARRASPRRSRAISSS